jgi:hypothetical protein
MDKSLESGRPIRCEEPPMSDQAILQGHATGTDDPDVPKGHWVESVAALGLIFLVIFALTLVALRLTASTRSAVPPVPADLPNPIAGQPEIPDPKPEVVVTDSAAPAAATDELAPVLPNDRPRLASFQAEWRIIEPYLKSIPEVGLGDREIVPPADTRAPATESDRIGALADRADFAGLPFQMDERRLTGSAEANNLASYSRALRREGVADSSVVRHLFAFDLVERREWLHPDAIPALVQLFGAEDETGRLALVRILSRIQSAASKGLARRALFDLSSRVRQEAITALRTRPIEEYGDILRAGLRYPWAPAARHAAAALAELDEINSIEFLVAELDSPDPNQPVRQEDGSWEVPELVRINHFRNCLVCHAPSVRGSGLVRGPVPSINQHLPRQNGYGLVPSPTGWFARADVVYLRQDFSVTQPVTDSSTFWPRLQRFDYLVRRKSISEDEACAWFVEHPIDESPHRQAVRGTLRQLTGVDAGTSAVEWKRVLDGLNVIRTDRVSADTTRH